MTYIDNEKTEIQEEQRDAGWELNVRPLPGNNVLKVKTYYENQLFYALM